MKLVFGSMVKFDSCYFIPYVSWLKKWGFKEVWLNEYLLLLMIQFLTLSLWEIPPSAFRVLYLCIILLFVITSSSKCSSINLGGRFWSIEPEECAVGTSDFTARWSAAQLTAWAWDRHWGWRGQAVLWDWSLNLWNLTHQDWVKLQGTQLVSEHH